MPICSLDDLLELVANESCGCQLHKYGSVPFAVQCPGCLTFTPPQSSVAQSGVIQEQIFIFRPTQLVSPHPDCLQCYQGKTCL